MASIGVNKTSKFCVLEFGAVAKNQTSIVTKPKQSGTAQSATQSSNNADALDIEQLILEYLMKSDIEDSWQFAIDINQDHQTVVGAIKALLPDAYVKDELITTVYYALTDEGKDIVTNGSPEFQVYQAIADSGLSVSQLTSQLGEVGKIGLGKCLQNKWVKKEGENIIRVASSVIDEVSQILSNIASNIDIIDEKEISNLRKRKLIQQVTRKSYRITKGESYQPTRVKRSAGLTREMLGNPAEVVRYLIFIRLLHP